MAELKQLLTTPNSPDPSRSLASTNQNTHSGRTEEAKELVFVQEAREIVRHMARHALYMALWSLRLFLLPQTRLFARLSSNTVLSTLATKLTPSTSHTCGRISQQFVQYKPCRIIASLWTRAVYLLSQLFRLWQRLNHLLTRLEEIELKVLEHNRHPPTLGLPASEVPSIVSTVSPVSPSLEPVTASQVYPASLVDNRTFEDLLALIDGERGFEVDLRDPRERSKVEVQHTPSSEMYGVRASPPRPSRLGQLLKVTPTKRAQNWHDPNKSCRSSTDTVSTSGISKSHVQIDASPDHARSITCDQSGSDSEQSPIRKGKPKPRFDTSKGMYNTVSKSNKTRLPRRVRFCETTRG